MKLADVSIKRPVFATMMIMSLVVLGLFSYVKLNVDLYPDVDFPYVVVTTVLAGAGPEQIETDVTKKVEDAVNTIAGVDKISSTSYEGASVVIIQFKLTVDGKMAAQDVREKVSGIRSNLPKEIEDPIIQRYDPASMPIMALAISGKRSEKEVTDFTKNIIKKRLENVPGVGNIELVGGAEREIEILVDASKLESYKLSIQDVMQSVGAAHVEIPGGNLIKGDRQVLLRTMAKFKTVEGFYNIVVANPMGHPVYLKDIATVIDGQKERTSLTRLNGSTAVGLNLMKQSGSNTVDVAAHVYKELDKLRKDLPPDINIVMAMDNSVYIRDSINDVLFDILYGGLLAVLVIYLFLGNMRATIISALALPSSIIASFIMMYALNFTLNMMSLLALSLAVGLLIDDAIVVIENIYRHMQQGETPLEAAKSASEEIGLAVMATTFTVVAVFVPVAFMPGIVGRYFFQFGMTISVAVLVSLFVAFTLTPMLSSRWLNKEDEELTKDGNLWRKGLYYFNHMFEYFSEKYKGLLAWSLHHRIIVSIIATIIFLSSMGIMGALGSQFFPDTDRSEFFIDIKAAPGSSIEQTSNICRQVEDYLRTQKEVINLYTTIGSGTDPVTKAAIQVKMVKKNQRKISDQDLIRKVRAFTKTIAGAKFGYLMESSSGGNGKPLIYSIRGEDLNKLKPIADKVEKILRSADGAVDVDNSLETSKPEVRILLDREKANDVAVNPYQIASGVRAMVDGYIATQYQVGDEQIDVRVKLRKEDRQDMSNIAALTMLSGKKNPDQTNILVRLGDIATVQKGEGPSQINRYQRQKEIRVDAGLSGKVLGEVVNEVKDDIAKIHLEPGYTISAVGEAEMQEESFGNILLSLMLAIVFVYIVLAAQFESFIHPFSIMLAMPMSIIGAVLFLWVFGSTVSVMSLIGIIMLMGLVTKNGILLVDYANVMRERGMSREEALLVAGPTRLRPILMTSFAMIFGMVPVAFALGEGSEFRAPMGQAVIGGIITSTFLTLLLVPVVYTLLEDFGNFTKRIFKRKKK
jgi:hydrophobe/amphiphile efflux-1 (HAE1) family protein